jgi:hypothetical protein
MKLRRRRKDRTSLRTLDPYVGTAASPNLLAHVLAVYVIDDSAALWVFGSPLTLTGEGEPCPQLRIQTASGWHGATSLGSVSPYLVACDYSSGDLSTSGGEPWEIGATPVEITFGAGVSLALPESGATVR